MDSRDAADRKQGGEEARAWIHAAIAAENDAKPKPPAPAAAAAAATSSSAAAGTCVIFVQEERTSALDKIQYS